MRIPGADQAIGNLVKWSRRDEWACHSTLVFDEHLDFLQENLDMTEDKIVEILGQQFDMLYGFILEDFFTARFGQEGEINIIDEYLERRGWREKVPARRYLQAIRDSVPSLYEVVALEPGRSLTVRDMVLGGDPVTVEEKSGSETAALWDRVAGRLVHVNGKPCFTGGLLLLPHSLADDVLSIIDSMAKTLKKELRRESKKNGDELTVRDREIRQIVLSDSITCQMITQTWLIDAIDRARAPLPDLCNSDGERIVVSEVRFPITGDSATVAATLDGIAGFERDVPGEGSWTWHKPASPSKRMPKNRQQGLVIVTEDSFGRTCLGGVEIRDGALVLNTLSTERADRGRELLALNLADLVGTPLTSHHDVAKTLERSPNPAPREPDLPPEMAERAMRSFMDDHYRRTLDDPLPVLDGKTPRQAAKTKKGRAQVIDWLKQLENSEFRQAADQGRNRYDTDWIWRDLKLQRSA